jgi:hypothetical protein
MSERQSCPACDSDALLNSRSRGALEDLYSVLGGGLYRCQNCQARFALFRRFTLPLGRTNQAGEVIKTTNLWLVPAAIFGGIVACLMVALAILRRFHRWPF